MGRKIVFALQAVTPLFSSGFDSAQFELRPSSVRGALRFWFRAMMGEILPNDLNTLKKLESMVFGSTEHGSPLRARCAVGSNARIMRRGESIESLPEGVFYPGFAFFRRERDGTVKLTRPCCWPRPLKDLKEDEDFVIEFTFSTNDPLIRNVVLGTFWLLLHLGGLGARTRRGFGALRLVGVEGTDAELFSKEPQANKAADFFCRHLQQIREEFVQLVQRASVESAPSTSSPSAMATNQLLPPFSCLARWQALIIRPKDGEWRKWGDVLGALGQELRSFRLDPQSRSRFGSTYDYRLVARFLDNQLLEEPDFQYDAFGLPIQYRSASRTRKAQDQARRLGRKEEQVRGIQIRAILKPQLKSKGEGLDRRASPLFVRPLLFADKSFGALLIFFEAQFLPPIAKEVLSPVHQGWPEFIPKPSPKDVKPADLQAIKNFLEMCQEKYNAEVLP